MSSEKVSRASVLVLLLVVVSVLSVCTAARRNLTQEMTQKGYSTAASRQGATATHPSNPMVKTNDYGRYDPTPAFPKPRFKLIPN